MKIIESIMTKNPCYTAGKKITVKGLMLHSVGCPQPKASAFINSWNKTSFNSACVHAFIDGNTGDIYQTLPWNHRGWHGAGSSNNTHIGVEMCEPSCIKYISGSSFTCSDLATAKAVAKRTYEAAVELFAFLCKKFDLNPLADGVIISHKEGYTREDTQSEYARRCRLFLRRRGLLKVGRKSAGDRLEIRDTVRRLWKHILTLFVLQ